MDRDLFVLSHRAGSHVTTADSSTVSEKSPSDVLDNNYCIRIGPTLK